MFVPHYSQDPHTRGLVTSTEIIQHKPLLTIQYDDYYEEVADFRTFPFKEVFSNAPLIRKRGKNADQIAYYDLVSTFDIETTSIEADPPFSFMYQWQFCLESVVFMGRTWKEFQELLETIRRELDLKIYGTEYGMAGRGLVCYCHNLSFEFQFARHYLPTLVNPLFTDKYQPLLVPTSSGIVFRCSQRLFNKSLEKVTKGFPHAKLSGDLDYTIKRTTKTKLTPQELSYCYNDVKGLAEALRDRLQHDRYNIASIPLTSTGYVRKDCQRAVNSNPDNRKVFLDTKLTPKVYAMCRDAFRGGNVHANAAITGTLLHNVASQDISSSYPAQILLRTFPISRWKPIPSLEVRDFFTHLIKTHCLLVRIVLFDIKYIKPDNCPFLSVSKCIIDREAGCKEDNGRIFEAGKIETCLTEIDLFLVFKGYKIGSFKILESYASLRGKLPKELRDVCFKYYQTKTTLKHSQDPDDIYNYNRAKELLNSTYGMMVQRLDRTDFQLVDNEYIPEYKPLKEQIDKFYSSRSSFLNYSHGLYVTAWARYQLQQAIDIVGSDFVYCDTDSCKYLHPEKYEAAFALLNSKLQALSEKAGAVAYDSNNNPVYIGTYDFEGIYTDFMTLGSKKYLYSYDNAHNIHSVISGVSKNVGQHFFSEHGFEYFTDGRVIADSGKLTAYYNDDPPHIITIDGVKIDTASSVTLQDAPYTINVKGEYQQFIDYLRRSVEQYYLQ